MNWIGGVFVILYCCILFSLHHFFPKRWSFPRKALNALIITVVLFVAYKLTLAFLRWLLWTIIIIVGAVFIIALLRIVFKHNKEKESQKPPSIK